VYGGRLADRGGLAALERGGDGAQVRHAPDEAGRSGEGHARAGGQRRPVGGRLGGQGGEQGAGGGDGVGVGGGGAGLLVDDLYLLRVVVVLWALDLVAAELAAIDGAGIVLSWGVFIFGRIR